MDFRNRTTQNQVAIAICVFVVFVCGGCSFFSTKHDIAEADSLAFHATVSADAMPMPLPVEIADDITRIANGEQPAGKMIVPTEMSRRLPSQLPSRLQKHRLKPRMPKVLRRVMLRLVHRRVKTFTPQAAHPQRTHTAKSTQSNPAIR